jgi:hypothetical protein
MGIFAKLSTDGVAKSEDNLGTGGGYIIDTDIQIYTIKALYAGKSTSSNAMSVTGIFVNKETGKEYRETFWVTSGTGDNFYYSKDKDGKPTDKKSFLPGFNVVNDICMITTDKPLNEQTDEEKVVKVYDADAKGEVPKSVPMLTETLGKDVALAIYQNLENKSVKNAAGAYEPVAEERKTNTVEKAMFPVFKTTVRETEVALENGGSVKDDTIVDAQGNDVAVFWDAWIEAHKGKIKDKRKIKDGAAGTAGKPGGKPLGGPPASGANPNAGSERKSLFNKG